MGKTKGYYEAEFPTGSKVKVASRRVLEEFFKTWKYHHKLQPQQLNYADQIAEVVSVGFYHGGDELYWLREFPGVWHEQLLELYTSDT